jgi:hypothetical protein
MRNMTKMFALGALGAGAIGAVAALRAKRRASAAQNQVDSFDFADLDDPVVITEEVIVVTEPDYVVDVELIPVEQFTDQQAQDQAQAESSFEMPGRGAGPR